MHSKRLPRCLQDALQDALQDDALRSIESGTGALVVVSSLDLVACYVRISLAINQFFKECQVRFYYLAFFNHPPFSLPKPAFSLLCIFLNSCYNIKST
jgi:hypothetical protein